MSSKTYNIAVIPGDGTGPEVVDEGIKVLNAAADKFGFKLNFNSYDWGGDRYLATGEVLPESAAEEMKKYDAIYLGAIGHPDRDSEDATVVGYIGGLFKLRGRGGFFAGNITSEII